MQLALKYRPKIFDDVVAQDITISILKNQIKEKKVKNMLLTGSSGVGKTTVARIIANELDATIIEVDAASNNSIENIRNLVQQANLSSIHKEYKVIILDEVHVLSQSSFQVLLKTLEEGNSKTIFILCTTDAHKIPNTILSRLQRFNFTRIPEQLIFKRLEHILNEEKISYEKDALIYISKLSQGGMREALTILDRVISYGDMTLDNTLKSLGNDLFNEFIQLTKYIESRDKNNIIEIITHVHNSGRDLKDVINQYFKFLLNAQVYLLTNIKKHINIPSQYLEEISQLKIDSKLLDLILKLTYNLKNEPYPKNIILANLLIYIGDE